MNTTDLLKGLRKKLNDLRADETPVNKDEITDQIEENIDFAALKQDAKGPLEGVLIFYINVGQMPTANVDKYLKRNMEKYKKILERMPDNYAAIWIPCRSRETAVEVLRF